MAHLARLSLPCFADREEREERRKENPVRDKDIIKTCVQHAVANIKELKAQREKALSATTPEERRKACIDMDAEVSELYAVAAVLWKFRPFATSLATKAQIDMVVLELNKWYLGWNNLKGGRGCPERREARRILIKEPETKDVQFPTGTCWLY